MESEKIIPLDPPITIKALNVTATELVLREPTALQAKKAAAHFNSGITQEAEMAWGIALVADVSGHPKQVIEALPYRKLKEATSFLASFLRSETTGDD